MRSGTNWLAVALAAMEPGKADGQPMAQQPDGQAPVSPAPTPTTNQNIDAGVQQKAEFDRVMGVSIPDAARRALPALNQSLYFLTNELMSRDDLRLPDQAARALAIEIMAEWLSASRKGVVSDLASVVASSSLIASVMEKVP